MESENRNKLRELLLSYEFTIGGLRRMYENKMCDAEEYIQLYETTTDSVIKQILTIVNK